MHEDFLEITKEGFLEAITAYKYIEMKCGKSPSNEINRLKRRWNEIKAQSATSTSIINFQELDPFNVAESNIDNKLSRIEYELGLVKTKLTEQEKITNQKLHQIQKQLTVIKESCTKAKEG